MARSKAAEKKTSTDVVDEHASPNVLADLDLIRSAPWLHAPWRRFVSMHAQDRVPHGLIISGDRGLGGHILARVIAAFLLCNQPILRPQEEAPCGACPACRLRQAGTHPDLIMVAGDLAAREISVEAVRGLIDAFGLTRHGSLRIAVIEQAERMNRSAANSLLKLLEEPPAGSLFLLTAERVDLLPSTIRSRIQRLSIASPNRTTLVDWLCQVHALPRPEAELLWFMGGADLVAGHAPDWDWQGVTQALSGLLTRRLAPLAVAKTWQGVDRETLARWLLRVWMAVQRLSLGLPCEAPEALCPALREMAQTLSAEDWLKRHPILLTFLQTATHPLNEELARERLALDLIDSTLPARLA